MQKPISRKLLFEGTENILLDLFMKWMYYYNLTCEIIIVMISQFII